MPEMINLFRIDENTDITPLQMKKVVEMIIDSCGSNQSVWYVIHAMSNDEDASCVHLCASEKFIDCMAEQFDISNGVIFTDNWNKVANELGISWEQKEWSEGSDIREFIHSERKTDATQTIEIDKKLKSISPRIEKYRCFIKQNAKSFLISRINIARECWSDEWTMKNLHKTDKQTADFVVQVINDYPDNVEYSDDFYEK